MLFRSRLRREVKFWRRTKSSRKKPNKDQYRASSKLRDGLNDEKSLFLAHNLDKVKDLLEKGVNLSATFDTIYYDILLSRFLV